MPSVAFYMGHPIVVWNVANPTWDKYLKRGSLAPITEIPMELRLSRIGDVVAHAAAAGAIIMLQEVHPQVEEFVTRRVSQVEGRRYHKVVMMNCDPQDSDIDHGVVFSPMPIAREAAIEMVPNTFRSDGTPANYMCALEYEPFVLVNLHNNFRLQSETWPLQIANPEVLQFVQSLRKKHKQKPIVIGGDWNADLPTVRAQMASIEGIEREDVHYTGTFLPSHFNSNDRALSLYDYILMINPNGSGSLTDGDLRAVAELESQLRDLCS